MFLWSRKLCYFCCICLNVKDLKTILIISCLEKAQRLLYLIPLHHTWVFISTVSFSCEIDLFALIICHLYTLSPKNDTDISHDNFSAHQPNFLIFGRNVTGLPLGSLNPLKSLFKHLVHNVPISQKWSLKFLFLNYWHLKKIFLAKIYVYIVIMPLSIRIDQLKDEWKLVQLEQEEPEMGVNDGVRIVMV